MPERNRPSPGELWVIAGPMFSGKTDEIIRRLKREQIARKKFQLFKHGIDTRFGEDSKISTHDGISFNAEIVAQASDILTKLKPDTEIVAIDEGQFFGEELIAAVDELIRMGKKVIVSGLALTYDRKPFEPIPTLMAMADEVYKLKAICSLCGKEAIFHKRESDRQSKIDSRTIDPGFVGGTDVYTARCRDCYDKKI